MSAEHAGEHALPVLVRQKNPNGCGIAALAMVIGTTYEVVADEMRTDCPSQRDVTEYGIHKGIIDWFLARHGFVWRTLYQGWGLTPWPPEPFAPVHIAAVVQPSGNQHFVVLCSDGSVLDPLTDDLASSRPSTKRLTDWPKVNNVQGIWSAAPSGSNAQVQP